MFNKTVYQREYMREYRKKHKDRINAYQREYYHKWKFVPVEVILKDMLKDINI